MSLISALRRQTQADLFEFDASLMYRVSSRTVKATQSNPISKKTNKQTNTQKGSQVTTCGSQVSPFIKWVLQIELNSLSLVGKHLYPPSHLASPHL